MASVASMTTRDTRQERAVGRVGHAGVGRRRGWVALLAVAAFVVKGGLAMAFTLSSNAFSASATIPKKYTCDATDVSPPLTWTDVPDGTKAFALICDDPDAPVGTWVHWVLFDLPAAALSLSEGVPATETLADGSKQGFNDFRRIGYGGPCPPKGPAHRYYFKLYALDSPTGLKPRANKADVLRAIEGHVLGEAVLMGKYQR